MIAVLRKEASSGSIDDLAHVRAEFCPSDCLTKQSAKPDALVKAIRTGVSKEVDCHTNFRTLLKRRAYMSMWCDAVLSVQRSIPCFLGYELTTEPRV